LQVDEVHGTHRCNVDDLARPLALAVATGSAANASGTHIGATLRWRDLTVGVLDERALWARVTRTLA
jgi:hypothetical protein